MFTPIMISLEPKYSLQFADSIFKNVYMNDNILILHTLLNMFPGV